MNSLKQFSLFVILIIFVLVFLLITCAQDQKCECNPKWHYLDEADDCCNAGNCKCTIREWPNTRNYTRLEWFGDSDDAIENKILVSPGQKYYSNSAFSSIYGNSCYFTISSEQDCKIIIDFKKFTFGYLKISLNGNSVSSYETIDINTDDILVFEANPGGRYSIDSSINWMVRFNVVEK
jgi:hypothetical protein